MTLVCRVEHRFPVAVVTLSGVLDPSTTIDTVVTLRGCLADQPVQLVLDISQVVVTSPTALRPLAELGLSARRWPGATLALAGAERRAYGMLAPLAAVGALACYATVEEAIAAGRRMPVPPHLSLDLRPRADAPATCRGLVARACRDWRLVRWQRLIELLASELVTNAVTHACTALTFTVRHANGSVQVAVRDGDPRLVDRPMRDPHPDRAPEGEHGRGMLLLDALADDWGCTLTSDGKVIWASVALSGLPVSQTSASAP